MRPKTMYYRVRVCECVAAAAVGDREIKKKKAQSCRGLRWRLGKNGRANGRAGRNRFRASYRNVAPSAGFNRKPVRRDFQRYVRFFFSVENPRPVARSHCHAAR